MKQFSDSQTRVRIAVTGTGLVCAAGNTADQVIRNLENPEQARAFLAPSSGLANHPTLAVGALRNFEPSDLFEAKELRRSPLFIQYAVTAAKEAWDSARMASNRGELEGCSIGTMHGSTLCYLDENPTLIETVRSGHIPRALAFYPTAGLHNLAAGMVSIKLGLRGPMNVSASGFMCGSHSIADAAQLIQSGDADVMICGAVDTPISPFGVAAYQAAGLARAADGNQLISEAPGFLLGEAAAMLVMESVEHALHRGGTILAEIAATHFGSTAAARPTAGQWRDARITAIVRCLEKAALVADDIDTVILDGWGNAESDQADQMVLAWLRQSNPQVRLLDMKRVIGHTLGASSAAEAVALAHILHAGEIPAALIRRDRSDSQAGSPPRLCALVSSSIGGMTSCVLMKKHD
jgi:3-oxoacyl-[acyl-carrier-protein] synthase II